MLEPVSIDPFNLPPATPAGNVYPNLVDSTQHARNNFKPRKRVWKRTISAQENEACLRRTLRKYWGYGDFRGPQLDICLSVMAGCDVLVVAPTGIGKSVCFQVPAVTQEYGVTIVVSPLLALMKDQVQGLNEKGIKAAMLYEKTDEATKKYVGKQLSMGHPELRLLYVTPETLFTARVNGFLRAAHSQRQLARLVIDEAHVIEEWGLTFRAAYRDLGKFREEFRDVPVTAVTASATEDVRDDIIDILKIKRDDLAQWVQPFNRKNLVYEVRYYNDEQRKYRIDYIADFIKTFRQQAEQRHEQHGVNAKCVSGLVYCRARMTCQDVAKELRDKGINALAYHAQLTEEQRDLALHHWKVGDVECIVATIAFGMGVDQAHVRYVVHYDMPRSFEGYYQETGRAGRDGHASRCILFYSREDAAYQRSRIEKDAQAEETKRRAKKTVNAPVVIDEEELGRAKMRLLNSFKLMQQYAESTTACRHIAICRYFGEQIDATDSEVRKAYCDKMCDVCCKPGAVARRAVQITDEVPVASQVVHAPRRFHSAPSIPSSRDTSTIANLHLSDALRHSSETPRHIGDAEEGASEIGRPEPLSDPLDIPTSSPPSTRSRSSRARNAPERPATSTLSTRPPASKSVLSRPLPLAAPAGSTAPPTARSDIGEDVDINVPRRSPSRGPKRQRTLETPRNPQEVSTDIPTPRQARRTHSTIFGRNATPGPSRTAIPWPAGRTRTVSTFDESPAEALQAPREPMTPDEAKRKAREKERFMAVHPLAPGRSPGGGPFAYYGNGRSTQGQLRVHASPANGINRPFRSPLIPDPQPRVVIERIDEENRATARAPVREQAVAKTKRTLEKVFKEGEPGEGVWLFWHRTEKGKKKSKALGLVARAYVEELGTTFPEEVDFRRNVELTNGAFRILLNQEGADIILNDELEEYKDDEHGQKLLLLRNLVKAE